MPDNFAKKLASGTGGIAEEKTDNEKDKNEYGKKNGCNPFISILHFFDRREKRDEKRCLLFVFQIISSKTLFQNLILDESGIKKKPENNSRDDSKKNTQGMQEQTDSGKKENIAQIHRVAAGAIDATTDQSFCRRKCRHKAAFAFFSQLQD